MKVTTATLRFWVSLIALSLPLCLGSLTARANSPSLAITPQYSAAALAPDTTVDIKILVTIEAPTVPRAADRQPVAISLVIDRSGSMEEAKKLEYAKIAGKTLVRNLGASDQLALVIYDNEVNVLAPLAPVTSKDKLIRLIDKIEPGSSTFLSGGLEKGIDQLKNVRKEMPCRIILLSDGLANKGVVGAEQVAALGAKARQRGLSVSTIGLGLDFDEDLMQFLAQRGGGQYFYIKDSEDLPAVFKQELGHVVSSFTKNLRTSFTQSSYVQNHLVYGYSTTAQEKGTAIDVGDLSAGEKRQIMLNLKVKTEKTPGPVSLGNLHLSYTNPESGKVEETTLPFSLEVVADEKARNTLEQAQAQATQTVKEEALIVEAEQAQVKAMEELQKGNKEAARAILKEQQANLRAAPQNKIAASKAEQMAMTESSLDAASASPVMQSEMVKKSKSSAYMSAKGQKQGILLQKNDSGFMVEKLQNALKQQGYYTKDIDGQYSQDVIEAVTAFQKAKGFTADGIAGPETLRALGLE